MKKMMVMALVLMSAMSMSAQSQQQGMKQAKGQLPPTAAERVTMKVAHIDKTVGLEGRERAKLERTFTQIDKKQGALMKKGMALQEKEQQRVKAAIGSEKFQKFMESRPQPKGSPQGPQARTQHGQPCHQGGQPQQPGQCKGHCQGHPGQPGSAQPAPTH